MAEYVQKHKSTGYHVDATDLAEQDAQAQAATHEPQVPTAETNSLLDEIDEILEENAEEFVRRYIQKGGQ